MVFYAFKSILIYFKLWETLRHMKLNIEEDCETRVSLYSCNFL